MLTTVIIVQTLINFVLMFSLFLLLRERMLAARLARARENRLEALAASFCALGQAITGGEQVVTNAGRTGESAATRPDSEATGSQETRRTSQPLGDAPETGEGWILSGKPNRDPRAPGRALSSAGERSVTAIWRRSLLACASAHPTFLPSRLRKQR